MKRALFLSGLSLLMLFVPSGCSDKEPSVTVSTDGAGTPSGTSDAGNGPGGGPDLGTPVGAEALEPTASDYIVDATGSAGLDKATVDALRAGGSSCATKVIYPYDGTVFPGALISPPLMFEGTADAAYVRVKYEQQTNLDFEFAVGKSSPGLLRIPQEHWNEITRRARGNTLLVTLSTKSGRGYSTCPLTYRVAQGNMVGSIYYNTYNHPESANVGAVLRLRLGSPAAEMYLKEPVAAAPFGPCISCHSVSASGSTLAASSHLYGVSSFSASSYAITDNVQPARRAGIQDATFGALTPQGDAVLRMGQPDCTQNANAFPRSKNNFPLQVGPAQASLVDTQTGNTIAATGLRTDRYMWMPQFSPDGKHVVFNDAKPDPLRSNDTDRGELAIMDYDPATHGFSNPRTIVSHAALSAKGVVSPSLPYVPLPVLEATLLEGLPLTAVPGTNFCSSLASALPSALNTASIPDGSCSGPCYPAWPFFTPDGKGVIFSLISEPDFAVAFPGRDKPSKSELWYVNIDSGALFRMDNANKGLKAGDSLANYYPTVLPVQVGGYFWVFWTSTRDFGSVSTDAPPNAVVSPLILGAESSKAAYRKRIWASAIRASSRGSELSSGIAADPSFPGFYLEGQSETGNTRAFAALSPCKASGNECKVGLDCCTGYCNTNAGASAGTCGEKVMCANTNERCRADADCCAPGEGEAPNSCIGGYCGFLILN